MPEQQRCFNVYFYRSGNGKVEYIDQTTAVSDRDAANNVRWNRFGNLSIEKLMDKHGIRIVAAEFGSPKDKRLDALSRGLDPDLAVKTKPPVPHKRSKAGQQTFFAGVAFLPAEPIRLGRRR